MCSIVLPLRMYMHHMTQFPQNPEEGIRSPKAGVTDGWLPTIMNVLGTESGSSRKAVSTLITTEPSLYPL